jgi:hypothetical protein
LPSVADKIRTAFFAFYRDERLAISQNDVIDPFLDAVAKSGGIFGLDFVGI